MGKGKKEQSAAQAPDAPRSVGRLVGLGVGVTVGLAAATTGLVAGVPAPDLLLRAVCAGVASSGSSPDGAGRASPEASCSKPETSPAVPPQRPEGDR